MITRTQKPPRPARWLLAAGVLAVALTGCASSAPTPAGAPPDAPLHTASTSLGEIVVDGAGMTAYVFDKDTAGDGASADISYEVFSRETLVVRAESTMVFIDAATQRPRRISDEERAAWEPYFGEPIAFKRDAKIARTQ
jgi:hypothetical protein